MSLRKRSRKKNLSNLQRLKRRFNQKIHLLYHWKLKGKSKIVAAAKRVQFRFHWKLKGKSKIVVVAAAAAKRVQFRFHWKLKVKSKIAKGVQLCDFYVFFVLIKEINFR